MLMTFLSAVYVVKMFLQGGASETSAEPESASDVQKSGGPSGERSHSTNATNATPQILATSKPHCPDWTTQEELDNMAGDVYDLIRDIRDPEKPNSLEELDVVYEEGVSVHALETEEQGHMINIEFTPTVPHCSLATLIGLCLRVRLERSLPSKHKIDIIVKKGTHSTEEDINKQINDKERIAAAMENPNLRKLVERCVAIDDY